MIRVSYAIVLVLSLVAIAVASVTQKQCMLPTTYDFEGVLQRQQAAAERAKQREQLLNRRHNEGIEEYKAKQEVERVQRQQEEAQRKLQKEVQKQQEEANNRLAEEARRKHEELHRKQHEEAVRKAQEQQRKQQEEAKRKQQQNNKPGQKPCPYSVLGVGRDATQAEIKSAYRKLAKEMHPDKNRGCEECEEVFTLLVDAYEILGDEDRRVMHDNESFGQYQSRPHNYNSKAGFYTGNSFVKALNQTEFDRLVLCKGPFAEGEECLPYMLHFYSAWCTHCSQMVPEWKRAASQMDGTETPLGYVQFAGVNCETNKQLCRDRGISAYPEIQLYAHDSKGQEHMERFASRRPRTVDNFIDFCEKGIRLAHESTLQSIDAFIMEKNVTNAESTGLWVVMVEGARCTSCGALKASLRRMSANIGELANFGVFVCDKQPKVCPHQYVGKQYPIVKLYPYKGAKGTGETLIQP